MIIDLIIDRKEGTEYNPTKFYQEVRQYEDFFELDPDISMAMDYGTEYDVRKALFKYIDENDYNANLKFYISKVNWLE